MADNQKSKRAKKEIEFNEHVYPSISAFCREFGFKYPLVSSYLRQGLAIPDIVKRCTAVNVKQEDAPPKPDAVKSKYACEYANVKYSSLCEASEALGLSLSTLYGLRRTKNLSATGALEMAMENKAAKGEDVTGNQKPCVVNGVRYASQAEALQAYKIPQLTVYSRMQREHISFEEALTRGSKDKKRIKPLYSIFDASRFRRVKEEELIAGAMTMASLVEALQRYGYEYTCYVASTGGNNIYAVKMTDEMLNGRSIEVYTVLDEKTSTIEFIVPELRKMNTLSGDEEINLLRKLNDFNSAYMGAKVYYDEMRQCIRASWSLSVKLKMQDTKAVITGLFSLLGACEEISRELES